MRGPHPELYFDEGVLCGPASSSGIFNYMKRLFYWKTWTDARRPHPLPRTSIAAGLRMVLYLPPRCRGLMRTLFSLVAKSIVLLEDCQTLLAVFYFEMLFASRVSSAPGSGDDDFLTDR